jgi:hypothetical protein
MRKRLLAPEHVPSILTSIVGMLVLLLPSCSTTPPPPQVQAAKRVALMIDPRISDVKSEFIGTTVFQNKTTDLTMPGLQFEKLIRGALHPRISATTHPYSQPRRNRVQPVSNVDLICCFTAREFTGSGFYNPVTGIYTATSEKRASIRFYQESTLGIKSTGRADVLFDCEVFEGATGRPVCSALASHIVKAETISPEAAVLQATDEATRGVLIATGLARPGLSSPSEAILVLSPREVHEQTKAEWAEIDRKYEAEKATMDAELKADLAKIDEKFDADMKRIKEKNKARMDAAKAQLRGASDDLGEAFQGKAKSAEATP